MVGLVKPRSAPYILNVQCCACAGKAQSSQPRMTVRIRVLGTIQGLWPKHARNRGARQSPLRYHWSPIVGRAQSVTVRLMESVMSGRLYVIAVLTVPTVHLS